MTSSMIRLEHGRATLALHRLRDAEGPPLLLLHGLRGSSADWKESGDPDAWPGSVYAIDFAGHGGSGWLRGGGYHPEIFAADADLALEEIGTAYVVGAGVGAYAALLLAGARPDLVPAALLLPGRGLDGGGGHPDFFAFARGFDAELRTLTSPPEPPPSHDPLVRHAETDVRPPEYASAFAERARRLILVARDGVAPRWWTAVVESPAAEAVHGAATRSWSELATAHLLVASPARDGA